MSRLPDGLEPLNMAWLSGLLEGEGCFTQKAKGKPRIRVQMNDRDVIDRVADIWDTSVIISEKNKTKSYATEVNGGTAAAWMCALLPHLGQRRSQRIKEVLGL